MLKAALRVCLCVCACQVHDVLAELLNNHQQQAAAGGKRRGRTLFATHLFSSKVLQADFEAAHRLPHAIELMGFDKVRDSVDSYGGGPSDRSCPRSLWLACPSRWNR